MISHLGATPLAGGSCRFLVWAPYAKRVELVLRSPRQSVGPMQRRDRGYYGAVVENVRPGTRYRYRLDEAGEFPDPASRFQPDGVHGASEVVDPGFGWTDQQWRGLALKAYILYELHVGTFTPEGTFAAAIPRLRELKELGITAIELMPVAQFPGGRNWGYDGVYPYAVQNSYGGPVGLKRLVNAAHRVGLAVVLDVVYNHLGPEGTQLGEFGPYFTDKYHTPWGPGLNFDRVGGSEVRRFFIENALYWQTEFHVDALRLDAIHAIRDPSNPHFLQELARVCHHQAARLNRPFYLIGESGLDIVRRIPGGALVGPGLDAEWRDDFHHCLHVLLTHEQRGYYARFGGVAQFASVWRPGLAATGARSGKGSCGKRAQRVGSPARPFVVFSQNHDQVGNRPCGERLSALASFEAQKLAAATVLLSPFIPLLFMGEEYGETAPFPYFVSHSHPSLVRAVRDGRRTELAAFGWRGKPLNPQEQTSFERAKLTSRLAERSPHRLLREFYRELIRLRRTVPALAAAGECTIRVRALGPQEVLLVHYSIECGRVLAAFNYSARFARVTATTPPGRWSTLLDSASRQWKGPGSAVAEELVSRDRLKLTLPAKSVLVLESRGRDPGGVVRL